jgi:hypothetical protein
MSPTKATRILNKLRECIELLENETTAKEPAPKHRKESSLLCKAREIYDVYPRKIGKPHALKAIKLALKKTPYAILLQRTKDYHKIICECLSRDSGVVHFVPHPATWYNQERYKDDPSTWELHPGNMRNINNLRLERRLQEIKTELQQHSDPPEALVKEYNDTRARIAQLHGTTAPFD